MFETREATRDDRPLIFATWLRSFRHGATFPRRIPEARYFAAHHNVVEALLDRSKVTVAHPAGDPEVILGWSVVETMLPAGDEPSALCVHFVYVKPAFRRAGIARRLLAHVVAESAAGVPVLYSHETFTLKLPQLSDVVSRWAFDPYTALQHAAGKEATE